MYRKLKQLLYRSFDQELIPEEKTLLKNGLIELDELQSEKQKISSLRVLLQNQEYYFTDDFSQRLLDRISHNNFDLDTSIVRIFPKFFYAAAAAIIILLITSALIQDSFSIQSILGFDIFHDDNLSLLLYDF